MIIHRRRESATDLPRGYTVAGYRIERVLGTGGMGAVYEATQVSLRRPVALKLIAPGAGFSSTARERFRREGKLQAVVDHPHILPVYEAGESRGRLFIAMRLVRGPTLKKLVSMRALDPARSLRILGDVARGLDAAHTAGLVHRDVKPQNILVDRGDYAYLADFGLSRISREATLTGPGQLLGSIPYMSPEQVRGERATDASDMYSFACVLYECLVGVVPFPRESPHVILHAHLSDPVPRPSEISPDLPVAVDRILAVGLAKDAGARPRTACTLVRELELALGLNPDPEDNAAPTAAGALPSAANGGSTSTELSSPVEWSRPRSLTRILTPLLAVAFLVVGATIGYLVPSAPSDTHTSTTVAHRNQLGAPSADSRLATDLTAAFRALNGAQAPLQHELDQAKTSGRQAIALAKLADAYRRARTDVANVRAPTNARPAVSAISVALGGIARSYGRLESAARHRGRGAYTSANTELGRREAELGRALRRLRRFGYTLS